MAPSFVSLLKDPSLFRGRVLRHFPDLLIENKEDFGKIITTENGKCKADAEGEVLFAASFFEWFGEEVTRVYRDIIPHGSATSRTRVIKELVGICGLIIPWNFPLAMGARKVAAALAAGCTVVMKTDGLTPFSSNAMAVLGERAGVPKGLAVPCASQLLSKKIPFTGSTRVGKMLIQQSSSTLKKLCLEPGGNAPFIVFNDVDLEVAIASILISKSKVTGQTCVCANRIFVQEDIYETFSQRLVEEISKFRVGNDLEDRSVTHGPFKNAKVLPGGKRLPSLAKNFHELTILGDTNDSMLVAREETFGPVAAPMRSSTEGKVIQRANSCAQNANTEHILTCYSFGGVKHSGMGHEGSQYGLDH
ncbi:Aldehyde/histidinol dehydrogenase [Aspergillus leporis]|uniref:Aldehyde/histidinol dehydrogenase n=1 Tax=Aspergillus leporis TaxID=41062 RepID=A0A5N5X144_9EURO|nr:Aldehyde/histidinol dehydrogenase [Aspergillus leporis]